MPSPYSRILRQRGAWTFSLAGLLARFPMSMVGISTILAIQDLYQNYSDAGAVSAAHIVAAAIGSPILARFVDTHGQARIMRPALVVSGLALVGLILAAGARAPLWALMALAATSGGLGGSMGSLVRSRWTALLSTPEDIHIAFSLEAALDEVAFIVGPVLATALCTAPFLPVTAGWTATLILQVGGGLWFLAQRATEPPAHPRPSRPARRQAGEVEDLLALVPQRSKPVLFHGAVLAIVAVFMFSGALFGVNDVTAVAFATEMGCKSAAGVVLAAWAVGSLMAALVYGSRSWGWPLWKQLLTGVVVMAVGSSTFVLAPNLLVLSALMVLTGMAIAPTVTAGNSIVQVTVAPSQLTEGLAWIGTALNIGVSLGSMAGGRVIDAAGSHGGYLLMALCGWLAVLAALVGLRTIRRAHTRHTL